MAKPAIFGESPICGVVAARTAHEAWRQFRLTLQLTSAVEFRFDWLANRDEVRKLLFLLKTRRVGGSATLIATCRRRDAGGRFEGTLVEQVSLLREAVAAGCDWVDVEVETARSVSSFTLDLYAAGAKRIISYHDFHVTPNRAQLARIAHEMEKLSEDLAADVLKVATQCHSLRDGLRLLELTRRRANVVAVPMGEAATPLRILAPRFGSALSYAPIEEATALGQVSLSELHSFYHGGEVGSRMRVYGVIGNPIAHSLSPVLHNAAFHARKIDAIYLPFLVTDLQDFLRAIEPIGIAGFSVTLPHKERILSHLDDCDPLAAAIGAVNTVVVRGGGKLFGYNTDYIGVLRAMQRRMPIAGSRVLILGAGGAARAVAFALAKGGASVSICARRAERASKLARESGGSAIPRAALKREFFDAIVNATPVGMHPRTHESPLSAHELNCRIVFDAIYRPRRTKLLQLAEGKGIETISGVEMFLAQGIAQWEIWTGIRAPEARMRRAVLQELKAEERQRKES